MQCRAKLGIVGWLQKEAHFVQEIGACMAIPGEAKIFGMNFLFVSVDCPVLVFVTLSWNSRNDSPLDVFFSVTSPHCML